MIRALFVVFFIFTAPVAHFSGKSGPQPPIPGLVTWLKADSGVTTVSGFVTAWNDQSGHGTNWTVPSAGGNHLTVIASAQNGLPIIRSPASTEAGGDCVKIESIWGSPASSQTGEIMVVLKSNIATNVENDSWSGFGNTLSTVINHFVYTDGNWYDSFGSTSRPLVGPSIDATHYHIANVSAQGTGSVWRFAGVDQLTTNVTLGWRQAWSLFDTYDEAATSCHSNNAWHGDIGEVLIWDHVLSNTDRTAAYSYLSTRWGIT